MTATRDSQNAITTIVIDLILAMMFATVLTGCSSGSQLEAKREEEHMKTLGAVEHDKVSDWRVLCQDDFHGTVPRSCLMTNMALIVHFAGDSGPHVQVGADPSLLKRSALRIDDGPVHVIENPEFNHSRAWDHAAVVRELSRGRVAFLTVHFRSDGSPSHQEIGLQNFQAAYARLLDLKASRSPGVGSSHEQPEPA